jgi:hypothetical protein
MWRRIVGGCVLAGAATLVALISIEIAVRALHLVPAHFWQPDPLVGTRLIAGKSGWWTQEELEFRVPVRINSQGFHDVEHAFKKPDGVTRVLVLGDSFVEAMQVPLEDAFARRLEHDLNGNADGNGSYEVISMGVSGYGTAGQLLTYLHYGRAYAADVVVLAFYPGNDVRNNSPVLEPVLHPVYADDGTIERIAGPQPRKAPAGHSPMRWLLENSQAYFFVRKRILTGQPALARWLMDVGLMAPEALQEVPMYDGIPVDYWVYAANPPPEWEDAWRHSEDLLRQFRSTVEHDGAHFVVAIVTARERIYPDSWEQIVEANPNMRKVAWNLAGPEQRVQRWCADNGVQCVTLSPAFLAHRNEGRRLHWVYDGHWTPAGHALAAATVAAALREQSWLSARPRKSG